ncbi:SusC/RagA family TonB-linked outer membrane protein [Chitinophaga sp. S165]|uniref:SusC/RagA family TonB-linked outer membrane protein n=1 Tax=Chitinophaga sp. S165 TaxID=2135462 RepID=UPI0013049258|nr:SusC/RagA family TonB-linked outer membrane protein [Chitinophaga sp. S165]
MRMTAFLMIVICLHIAAKGVSQVVSIKARNLPLKEVFVEMSKQTGISILYKERELQHTKPVSLDVKNAPFRQVLDNLLKDQELEYQIQNEIIFIEPKKNPVNFLRSELPAADTNTIDLIGVIVHEETQKPLDGVTVMVKGSKQGAVTVGGGSYVLKAVPRTAILVISSIGYITQEVPVMSEKNQKSSANFIKLKPYVSQLDETVIQAYGTTTKRKTTGDIVTVKGEDLAKQPIFSPLLGMQGRVAGLEITQQNGSPIGAVKVELRGRKSIDQNFTSDPLYIIDGVPLTVLEINGKANMYARNSSSGNVISSGLDQTGLSPSVGVSPLSAINPADIASVEILKDADATAIYGSRGANGVILITTRKGKAGVNGFNVSAQQGISFTTGHWDILNTPQYVAMRREAYKNDGITPQSAPGTGYAPDIMVWDTTRYTDWQKYFWNNVGKVTNVQADMSGGSEQVTYRIGGGYNRSTDLTKLNGATTRATAAVNVGTQSRNRRFRTDISATYGVLNTDGTNRTSSALIPPNAPPVYDSLGHLNYGEYRISTVLMPGGNKFNTSSFGTNLLMGSFAVSYNVTNGLYIRSTFGYNLNQARSKNLSPIAAKDPVRDPLGSATFANSGNSNLQIEPQAEYTVNAGKKGRLNVLAGATLQSNKTWGTTQMGNGFTSDVLLTSINNAPTVKATDASAQYKYAGTFGRIGYTWDDKYILNLNGRRDGSSRFGSGHQFGNFGSLGAAWILSDEHWIRQHLPALISFVKLRGSVGVTGSDQIGDYQYLTQWGVSTGGTQLASPYNGISPLIPQLQANPDFHWQTTRKLEGALNVALLDDRISMEAAWYRERCNNQLIGYPTPVITGFISVVENSPASIQNSGLEFSVNARAIERTDFSWNMKFNISRNTNVLLAFPMLEKSPYLSRYKIGDPISALYLYHYTGVDPVTGVLTYEDHNHDGEVKTDETFAPGTGKDDRYVKINLTPAFQGGFSNTVRLKNVSLTADFVFVKQMVPQSQIAQNPGNAENISRWAYENRWQYPGQHALSPKLSALSTTYGFSASDGNYTDGSYLRLNTVQVSYRMPAHLTRMLRVNSFAANISAQNIFVITPYKGMDPAMTSFGTMPPARIITAGVTCGF